MGSVYSTARWQRVRRQRLELDGYRCMMPVCLCPWGRQLDVDAEPRSRWAPSVDHIRTVLDGGDPYDLANTRSAHVRCNTHRANQRTKARHSPIPRGRRAPRSRTSSR